MKPAVLLVASRTLARVAVELSADDVVKFMAIVARGMEELHDLGVQGEQAAELAFAQGSGERFAARVEELEADVAELAELTRQATDGSAVRR